MSGAARCPEVARGGELVVLEPTRRQLAHEEVVNLKARHAEFAEVVGDQAFLPALGQGWQVRRKRIGVHPGGLRKR